MTTTNLYEMASLKGITIKFCCLPQNKSVSACMDNRYFIGVDSSLIVSSAEEKTKLAHELGHCITNSFYDVESPLDVRGKHEYEANKWAVKKLIPKDELEFAIKNGCDEVWKLAVHFDVSYEFIEQAIYFYFEAQMR